MDVAQFDFDLPRSSIAQRPARPRDAARMLDVLPDHVLDLGVRDLPSRLQAGDLLVFNDTKVIPARIEGVRSAARGTAKVEVTLNRPLGDGRWSAFARPAKRLRAGDGVDFGSLRAEVVERGAGGEVTLAFAGSEASLFAALEQTGSMPLPPYMSRDADADDRSDYQTMFARAPGAVAAPTAALHFTPRLMAALAECGVAHTFVTLHVGAGTFLPVTASDTAAHRMHPEWGEASELTVEAVTATRQRRGRVVAVGTTALRVLESAARNGGGIEAFRGETSLFITPGYRFGVADLLLTNFHLPRSTLFMLVCAFAGTERMQRAYAHARDTGYRFYSYGDCCLLHRESAS